MSLARSSAEQWPVAVEDPSSSAGRRLLGGGPALPKGGGPETIGRGMALVRTGSPAACNGAAGAPRN
ncbi:MAG: hypothetical protein ACREOV_06995 [Candidatus Dormibacteraceae bacterium]